VGDMPPLISNSDFGEVARSFNNISRRLLI
jgi:hypothetical protein